MQAALKRIVDLDRVLISVGGTADTTRQQNIDALSYLSNRIAADSEDGLTEVEARGLARILHLVAASANKLGNRV